MALHRACQACFWARGRMASTGHAAPPGQGNFWRSSGRAGLDIVPTIPIRPHARSNVRGFGAWLSFRPTKRCLAPLPSPSSTPDNVPSAGSQPSPVATARPRRWCDAREPPTGRRLRRPSPRDATSRRNHTVDSQDGCRYTTRNPRVATGFQPVVQSPPFRERLSTKSDTLPAASRPFTIAMAKRPCVFAPLR
jgi:hypothetical protein